MWPLKGSNAIRNFVGPFWVTGTLGVQGGPACGGVGLVQRGLCPHPLPSGRHPALALLGLTSHKFRPGYLPPLPGYLPPFGPPVGRHRSHYQAIP